MGFDIQKLGYEMLKRMHIMYDELFKNYGGETVKEEYDEYGCEWVVRVDGSLFRFAWDYRDFGSFDVFDIRVMLGCPDPSSSLNEWWSWAAILEFISSVWNLPQPSFTSPHESQDPKMIELIIRFIRDPDYYHKWCVEFDDWRKKIKYHDNSIW